MLCCINYSLFALGLNLVSASYIFLMDMWWNGCLEDQAIDRVHRITQQKQVRVVRYCMAESVEMKILALQEEKRAISKGTFSETLDEAKVLSLKDICKLFGVDYGGKRYRSKRTKRRKTDTSSGKSQTENDFETDIAEWDNLLEMLSEQLGECVDGTVKPSSELLVPKTSPLQTLAFDALSTNSHFSSRHILLERTKKRPALYKKTMK